MGGGASRIKGKAAATAVIFQKRISESHRFFNADALLASVESGAIAMLSGRYLATLHRRGGRLARRQDLPPDATLSIQQLRRLVSALGDEWGRLFVAVSYRSVRRSEPLPSFVSPSYQRALPSLRPLSAHYHRW